MDPLVINDLGQLEIPQRIREELGLYPGVAVSIQVIDQTLQIRSLKISDSPIDIIERMRGKATSGLTTDEIMSLSRQD